MVTVNSKRYIQHTGKWDFDFKGLSTDTKPTVTYLNDKIADNSLFLELDTKTFYFYDNGSWQTVGE